MRRRSRAGGEPAKAQRRKTGARKSRITPKAVRPRSSSAAREETEVERLTRELNEALEQQTAMSEVLRVISQSKFELQSVLQSVAETAARLCRSDGAVIFQLEGGIYRFAAGYSLAPAFLKIERQTLISPGPGTVVGRAAMTRRVARIDDALADPLYEKKEDAKVEGNRSMIGVPVLRDGEPVVVIGLGRRRFDPFGKREIELATTFAAQALIAIENARLVSDLRDSLQQQTATADVLKVISRSIFDLQTVLDTLVESAARLCNAERTLIYRPKDGSFHHAASYGYPKEFREFMSKSPLQPGRGSVVGRTALEKTVIQVTDTLADPEFTFVRPPNLRPSRTLLGVPLIREGTLIGVMGLARPEVKPFNAKEIELATTFADQAVIAIENTRLFEAEQQRTRELSKSLEQQTATSEVLQVISRSTFDLQKVLNTLVESAARLCEADMAIVHRLEGSISEPVATYGITPDLHEQLKMKKFEPGRATVAGRVLLERRAVHVHDVRSDPEYPMSPEAKMSGVRTALGVPLQRESTPIGMFVVLRRKVQPFTERQIELLSTFADQAVIAIENTRLFEAEQQRTRELAESLEQQTATSKVLDVISRSAFDLRAVFDAVIESSVRLCGADRAFIMRFDGELLRMVVTFNASEEHRKFAEQHPIRPGRHSAVARAALERRTVHIPDVMADPEYTYGIKDVDVVRTVLAVPILKGDDLLGVMLIYHVEVRPFTDKQIALVETFADQAAIAIENVRLLDELRQRTDELGRSVGELRALGEVSQAVNSTLDLETVLSTIVAKAVQLSGTEAGAIYVFDEVQREFHLRATYGMDQELIDTLARQRIGLDETTVAQALAQREPVQIADLSSDHPRPIRNHSARRFSRSVGSAAAARRGDRGPAGSSPSHARRLPAEHR